MSKIMLILGLVLTAMMVLAGVSLIYNDASVSDPDSVKGTCSCGCAESGSCSCGSSCSTQTDSGATCSGNMPATCGCSK